MTLHIYWISGSAPAWRVLLALELKGLTYQSTILEASKGEQKSEPFLSLNPRGQVPVLTDDEVVICESRAILWYLEKRAPEPALFGRSAAETADITQCFETILDYVDRAITQFVRPIFRDRLDGAEQAMRNDADTLRREFELLDTRLQHQAWLASDAPSAADIALIPALQRFSRALRKSPRSSERFGFDRFDSEFEALNRWKLGTEQLAAFDASFPPHWR